MRTIAGIVLSALVGVALAVAASFAIVSANAPDRSVEATIENRDFDQPRQVVQYGQR